MTKKAERPPSRCEQMETLLRALRANPRLALDHDFGAAIDQVLRLPAGRPPSRKAPP